MTKTLTLTLNLKTEYFEAIKNGSKSHEFRLVKPYWTKRLQNRRYDQIMICCGYPAAGDDSKRIIRPWRGYEIRTITHAEFGDKPVEVFAIDVSEFTES